ncbi:MAG: hypothetical protein UY63_C0004G0041 [Parcubacteria group bacterium GW2011_GWA2_51_10]|nr:MAG: hypothetical protein UY63_C0004G0041 [Parcubacteria group bacterium GW2011_GWA2_51_10]
MSVEKVGGRRGFESKSNVDKASQYQQTVRKQAEILKTRYPEEVGWIEDVVQAIDFDELRGVFFELTAKSQVAREDVNFIPRENIFIVPPSVITTPGSSSAFKIEENVILMSAQEMLETRKKRGEIQARQIILYELIHEYCHAVGANRAEQGPYKERSDVDLREKNVAYAKVQSLIEKKSGKDQVIDSANSFMLFNEGITDEIAHRVLETYLSRKDFFGITASSLFKKEKEGLFSFSPHMSIHYRTARTFADMLVDRISKISEVPKDVVWNGVIGDYFRGTGLPKELLDEVIGPGFTYNLGEAESAADLKDLAKHFDFSDPRPGTVERLKSYFRSGIRFE